MTEKKAETNYLQEKFFQEYLKRSADQLYEWSLMLHYFWNHHMMHHKITRNPTLPDDCLGTLYLCEECHNKLIDRGEYIYQETLHDPGKDSFPPRYDDFVRLSIKMECDSEFRADGLEIQENIKRDGDKSYFPEHAEKEYALVYLDGNREERERIELSNRNSFHVLSTETRCLSILYGNFSDYLSVIQWSESDLVHLLDSLKDEVIADCHEMIGYWKLTDVRKKLQASWNSKGGSASKYHLGILAAVKRLFEDNNRTSYSAKRLWDIFENRYKGIENALDVNGYKVYFDYLAPDSDQERLFQISPNGKIDSISEFTFRRYPGYSRRASKNN